MGWPSLWVEERSPTARQHGREPAAVAKYPAWRRTPSHDSSRLAGRTAAPGVGGGTWMSVASGQAKMRSVSGGDRLVVRPPELQGDRVARVQADEPEAG